MNKIIENCENKNEFIEIINNKELLNDDMVLVHGDYCLPNIILN